MQFWYTDETAGTLAKEVVEAAGPSGRIACIACPSLFRALRTYHQEARAHLFEVDLRFEVRSAPCPDSVVQIAFDAHLFGADAPDIAAQHACGSWCCAFITWTPGHVF